LAAAAIGVASIAKPTSTVTRPRLEFIVGYLYLSERALRMPSTRFSKPVAIAHVVRNQTNKGCTKFEIKKRKTSTERMS
jgi:hypothetical protein